MTDPREIIRLQERENAGEELTPEEWATLRAHWERQLGYYREDDYDTD